MMANEPHSRIVLFVGLSVLAGCVANPDATPHPAMTGLTEGTGGTDETAGPGAVSSGPSGHTETDGGEDSTTGGDGPGEDEGSSSGTPGGPVVSVEFTQDSVEMGTSLLHDLPLLALDADGNPTHSGELSFEVSSPELLSIDEDWRALGLGYGTVTLTATAGDVSDSIEVVLHQGWQQLATGFMHTCAADGAGDVYCWGCNTNGMIGAPADWAGGRLVHHRPRRVEHLEGIRPGGLAVGHKFNCAVGEDDALQCWGYMEDAGLGQTADGVPIAIDNAAGIVSLDIGYGHALGLTEGGSLYAFGRNADGELGDGTQDVRSAPVAIAPALTFASVAAGGESDGLTSAHSCGITTDADLYCWGANGYGQVGIGSTSEAVTEPALVELPGGHDVVYVDAGAFHTCAVDDLGDAYCWGGDHQRKGVLGDGEPADEEPQDYASPHLVVGEHSFVAVVAGFRHTSALTTEGTLMSWGSNDLGILGTEDAQWRQTSPVPVDGLEGVSQLDTYTKHTCALTERGVAHCYGQNFTNYNGTNVVPHTVAPTRLLDPDPDADPGPDFDNCIYVEPPWDEGVANGDYDALPE